MNPLRLASVISALAVKYFQFCHALSSGVGDTNDNDGDVVSTTTTVVLQVVGAGLFDKSFTLFAGNVNVTVPF